MSVKYSDLKKGEEFSIQFVVSNAYRDNVELEPVFNEDVKSNDNTYGSVTIHKDDFEVITLKPLTKAQKNAKIQVVIKDLERQLIEAKKRIIK